jgi:hypothetical protein
MRNAPTSDDEAAFPDTATDRPVRPHWIREIVTILAFYLVYQQIRGFADTGGRARAFANARLVVRAERWLHIFNEQAIQSVFLGARWFIRIVNIYYGTLHFIITLGLLGWLYMRRHHHYRRMRNLLGLTTGLALIGYWAFPLAPPRMLPCSDGVPVIVVDPEPKWQVGKCFVDTLDRVGGLWNYYTPVAKAASNSFAAMPSLHFGWALWCGIVFYRFAQHRWSRSLAFVYPLITLFAIVVTANHYWLDAVGGAIVLVAAAAMLHLLPTRRSHPAPEQPADTAVEEPAAT